MVGAKLFTTPIFYVNARPHLGHLHSMVLADVLHRYALFRGHRSVLSTGTDEHGMKVADAAAKAGVSPKPFVDGVSQSFRALSKKANIDVSRFIRTTDADHIKLATRVWKGLQDSGFIYRGVHRGWYCVSDENFCSKEDLMLDRNLGRIVTRESRNPVQWSEETNYFFRLDKFRHKLIDHFRAHRDFVKPSARHEALLSELEGNKLSDLSISRPTSRCPWGIPVPGDHTQTMYVWFEALLNYLTVAESFPGTWPATAHIVGKDIVRFHAIYWPAFLMASGHEIPTNIVVHGHWTLEGNKMSKSHGNVVDPISCMQFYGIDTLRYFLMHDCSLNRDVPFSYSRLIERHNVNLVNKLGNLVSRVCGPKFDIRKSLDSKPPIEPRLRQELDSLVTLSDTHMSSYTPQKMVQHLNEVCLWANQIFQNLKPWASDPSVAIASCAETCRIVLLMLQPVCPSYSQMFLDRLGVPSSKRTSEFARLGADNVYGVGVNHKGGHVLKRLAERSGNN